MRRGSPVYNVTPTFHNEAPPVNINLLIGFQWCHDEKQCSDGSEQQNWIQVEILEKIIGIEFHRRKVQESFNELLHLKF